ncbi:MULTISPECIES: ribosome biogenesis GTPase Der [Porphyromonadaceae]|uniref:GTPase Der n=1 Tax=Sanguibacteroides justesenii TaxID=1547597 RepID=A0A0C3RDA9_9PORP|nr:MULTISPECIES: ribosome biogenesis GTPase Der [Porphyromonadaceae]KIO42719.1 GTP-binding protein Der [Sanguibacteroides justesenii]KIO46456.1 GTP-binding protein Der [Sanguibacteroides justesenii]MCR9013337.1 ribosome biogenesis GTPase Der [Gabonibacter chumensis]PXZ42773.1 ribosome biogenesis GTPase Der [Sanguibacteroides justesenii]
MSNIVAIVGRPNVGKSTLFNRLIGKRKAIVNEESGVTRDRNYGKSDWIGKEFSIIDTGGYVSNSSDIFEEEINKQVMLALDEADVILFVCDVELGITDLDQSFAKLLRKVDKPIYLVVNKVDNGERLYDAHEFYKLGIGEELFPISSASGSGTGDLLDKVVSHFSNNTIEETEHLPKIAIVGRPNVGKSSTINALIGEERNIVTDVAGTTRDTLATRYNRFGHDFLLIDTAGLRKRTKVNEDVEFYSVMRSVRAIEDSDICMLLIDATRGMESQDLNIFHLIERNQKGVVILVNKWDLIEKDNKTLINFEKELRMKIAPFDDVQIIFTSALTKQRLLKALEAAIETYKNRSQKIKTSELNNVMLEEIENFPPPSMKGKYVRIKYITQLPTATPAFAFYCNLPQYVKDPYKRFLENKIREHWKFTGVPIQIFMRKK